ncbi:MAG: 2-oxoacid:acceptor oxidoreductase family protein [Bacillota bacterium]
MPGKNKNKTVTGPVQIQLTGSGGQGLILAGIILAEAAVREGYHVVQTQAYGPEARGGASRAEVIISPVPIDYPHVESPDILLALTQEACNKYLPAAGENSLAIIDSLLVRDVPETGARVISLPIIETAKLDLGKEMVANIVALGCLNRAAELLSWQWLEDAVAKRSPPGTEDINRRALESGRNLAGSVSQ